jgi:hypothetical protein
MQDYKFTNDDDFVFASERDGIKKERKKCKKKEKNGKKFSR